MKKLKLNQLKLNGEILSREQLKTLIGGAFVSGSGSGHTDCQGSGELCWGYVNCCNGLFCYAHKCTKTN